MTGGVEDLLSGSTEEFNLHPLLARLMMMMVEDDDDDYDNDDGGGWRRIIQFNSPNFSQPEKMGREKNYEPVSPTIIFTQYYHYDQASPLSKYGFQLSFVGVNLRLLRAEILSSNIIIQQINSNYSWSALIWGNRRRAQNSFK